MCSCVRGEGPGQTALCDFSKILRAPVSKLCAHAVLGLIVAHLPVTQTRTTEGTTAAAAERRSDSYLGKSLRDKGQKVKKRDAALRKQARRM